MAEDLIEMKSKTVVNQVKTYLNAHPGLQKERFQSDPEFKEIAVQPVGKTGYTALYEIPGPDEVWRTWAHVNPNIIGIDMKTLKKPLGKSFSGFWNVYSGVKKGKQSRGYYTWQDKDKEFRDKFMVCTPVEGTPYVIAATTYLYEFTTPVKALRAKTAQGTTSTMNTIMAIMGATILLIGVIVSLFGHRLTGRIQSLTDVADRISVGELEADIEVKSRDEIGDLADAISRMQDSIRLSIERLRRRR
jgi:methyl-accepting chemotaxis protein